MCGIQRGKARGFCGESSPTPDRRGKGGEQEKKKGTLAGTCASTKFPTDVGERQLRGLLFVLAAVLTRYYCSMQYLEVGGGCYGVFLFL
jgi:hypothetical protein